MAKKITILFLLLTIFTIAQDEKIVPGQLIVQFQYGVDKATVMDELQQNDLQPIRVLSRRMNIWLVKYNAEKVAANDALSSIEISHNVKLAQHNHVIELREASNDKNTEFNPNDPRFDEQWALNNTGQSGGTVDADIDAPEAWDLQRTGSTALGDSPVVAVVDGGFEIGHDDIDFWVNPNEIPGNNIDDDNNGYIDDVNGWNVYNSNGTIPSASHGTHVAGIAGAIGNNGIGVSGVHPDVKVLAVAGSSTQEDVVVAAYSYIHELRATYNETNGAEGAFIVVTNASFGVDYGNPANYPIWCGMYDSLGVQGILSCAATANIGMDIDVNGDVPTACSSDYLISVTNTTRYDERNSGAGYGLTTIDLGAPGTAILNTVPGNSYDTKTGTSMATPTVAGAVALVFSAANTSIMEEYMDNPGPGALLIKEYIMDNVDVIPALQDQTVSGGRLNLYNSVLAVSEEPDAVPPTPITDLAVAGRTSNSITLSWTTPMDTSRNGVTNYDIRYAMTAINSDTDFEDATMVDFMGEIGEYGDPQSFMLENLSPGTHYFFAVKSNDVFGNTSDLSNSADGNTFIAPDIAVNPASISASSAPNQNLSRSFTVFNTTSDSSTLNFSIEMTNNTFPESNPVVLKVKPKASAAESVINKGEETSDDFSLRRGGGPDMFGYEWTDSSEPNGPVYQWNDISSTGTEVTGWMATGTYSAEDEGYVGPLDLGFNFSFYGEDYSQVYISTNGFITFSDITASGTFSNTVLPNSGQPNNMIAGFWDDLKKGSGNVYVKQEGNKYIIQFDSWEGYSNGGVYTYQYVLSHSKIEIFYNSMDGSVTSATVGIENNDGSDGLTATYNSALLSDELAIVFAAEPDWLAINNTEGMLYNGGEFEVELAMNTFDLVPGTYSMDVVITSNDPDEQEVTVPVSLSVSGSSGESWSVNLSVNDGTKADQNITFGFNPSATDGIDTELGEEELPPLPPAGVFDTRFEISGFEGSLVDMRNTSAYADGFNWNFAYQKSSSSTAVTISWDNTSLPAGNFILNDAVTGNLVSVNMKEQSSLEVTNASLTDFIITYSPQNTMDMNVSAGWNLVSVCLESPDMSTSTLYPDATSPVYAYNDSYVPTTSCVPGIGYWAKFDDNHTYQISGEANMTTISVKEGWNIIGSFPYSVETGVLVTTPADILTTPFYSFEGSYATSGSIEPGEGYWVKASANGTIYVSVNAAKKNTNPVSADWNKLVITDANGNHGVLYLSSGSDYVEMPPLPPAGFDVRFTSNSLVENANGSRVNLTGVTFPVTVTSEDVDLALNTGFGSGSVALKAGETVTINETTSSFGVELVTIPDNFELSQNYPNPFNPSTTIKFGLPVNAKVNISVYNTLGERVAVLSDETLDAGTHEINFNAAGFASGIYFYTVSASGIDGKQFNQTKKMLLIK